MTVLQQAAQTSSVFVVRALCGAAQVPLVMYLMTHAYFCFYHAISNLVLRRVGISSTMPAHDARCCNTHAQSSSRLSYQRLLQCCLQKEQSG